MVLSMERFQGKVAIVTGASSGCGAAIAEMLVKNGIQVVGLARRVEMVAQLSAKLVGMKGKLHPFKADMTCEDDILAAFNWAEDNLGPVHILVNNAGIAAPDTLINGKTSDWKRVLDTNVLGVSVATREAVQRMTKNKVDGHIIHVNSVLGHYVLPVPDLNVYPASKFALSALTETLRRELNDIGSKIRISSVSPGAVDTEFSTAGGGSKDAAFEEFFNKLPKLKTEDVADAVWYVLATPPYVQVHDVLVRPQGEHV